MFINGHELVVRPALEVEGRGVQTQDRLLVHAGYMCSQYQLTVRRCSSLRISDLVSISGRSSSIKSGDGLGLQQEAKHC